MVNSFAIRSYIPILSVSPAEMSAIEQLPDKDKDQLLPLFPLRGWVSSHRLESTLKRIFESIGDRPWIADVDESFLTKNKIYLFTGRHPDTPIFQEIKALLDPRDCFEGWCNFIKQHEQAIPCIRHETLSGLKEQVQKLNDIGRGVVLRISPDANNIDKHSHIINIIQEVRPDNVLVMYDLETIDVDLKERIPLLERFIEVAKNAIPNAAISISSSSFPAGFSGQNRGENSIYERILFNAIESMRVYSPLIYSDRGGARANKLDGGSGTPPPRIDYPTKKDWKFVRREVDGNAPNSKERRKAAYIEIAQEITSASYWAPEVRLWGTQQIELTAEGDNFGIYSPQRSTAVRINIHLFNQLYYNAETKEINTDEEWVD